MWMVHLMMHLSDSYVLDIFISLTEVCSVSQSPLDAYRSAN